VPKLLVVSAVAPAITNGANAVATAIKKVVSRP
jgi:hypothetical protein